MVPKTRTKAMAAAFLILFLLSASVLGALHASAHHGNSNAGAQCNARHAQAYANGINPHETGVDVYAYAEVEWIFYGPDDDFESDHDDFSASVEVFIEAPGLTYWAWHSQSYGAVYNAGGPDRFRPCEFNLIPISDPWQDKLEALPEWVQLQIREVGCSISTAAGPFAFNGEIHYHSGTETTWLKQTSNAVNLTASPILTAEAQTTSKAPSDSVATDIHAVAFGSAAWGCEAELRV